MLSNTAIQNIKEMLAKAVENKDIAGANLLVLEHNEEIFYFETGYAHIESQKKMQRDSIFRLYSMTKPVTAVAVMKLMEQGLIDLYESVETFLPGFKGQKVVVNGEQIEPKRPVNIMDLLAMTSGLVYGGESVTGQMTTAFWNELDARLLEENAMTTVEAMNQLGHIPLLFHPGEAWEYGTSADVLGAIVEIVSGKKFSRFLEDELFKPLGMTDTGFYVPEEKRHRLVTTYERVLKEGEVDLVTYSGNHLGIINAMDREPAFESGGAGLVSTIDDYAKFAQMLMQEGIYNGTRILKAKNVEYLTTRILTQKQQAFFDNWHTLAGHSYGSLMRIVTDTKKAGTIASLGEYGWDGWLGAYFANCPLDDVTILFMIQLKDAGTTTTTRKLRNLVLGDLCQTT